MTGEVQIRRVTKNKLNDKKLKEAIKIICEAAEKKTTCVGVKGVVDESWDHHKTAEPIINDKGEITGYIYAYKIIVSKENPRYRTDSSYAKAIGEGVKFIMARAKSLEWEENKDEQKAISKQFRGRFEPKFLTQENIKKYFSGIYERQQHLNIISDAVRIFAETDGKERNHVLLYGLPASAKTILFKCLKDFYEEDGEVERLVILNSTTLSKAGLENWFYERSESGTLPEIVCFDELEKFQMDNLNCLLQIMDSSSKISRLNSRQGKIEAETKCIVMGTVNDMNKFRNFADGALASRFVNSLYCRRPTPELMFKILNQKLSDWENAGIEINRSWAKLCMSHAKKHGEDDPRKIISWLAGKNRLEDGSYFKDLEETAEKIVVSV